jgi:hypothetical protein
MDYDTGSCGMRWHIFSVTGAYTGQTIYVGSPGSCAGTPPSASFSYFEVGAEVPASSFQSATIQLE